MIEIDRISYTYPGAGRPALHDLSLTIAEGEFLLVCGASGAGKSTFLRLLNGLAPHFHGGRITGDVRVWGRSTYTHQPRDLADLVGFVFQDPEAQFVVDVVEDEIVFAMENLGLPQRIMRRRVEEVLDQLGIAHLRRRKVASLSGGERQRVAIASVLAAQPRALALDEPTSQIDPHGAEEVLTALQKLNADLGLTIVLSEHRLERVVQYADRMLYFPPPGGAQAPISADMDAPALASSLRFERPIVGPTRDVLAQIDLTPPLARLGSALGWSPLPLTIKEGRRFVSGCQPTPLPVLNATSGDQPNTTHAGATDTPQPTPDRQSTDGRVLWRRFHSNAQASGPPARSPLVSIAHVHFAYGAHEALYDVSLDARPGEVLALMGRNGSGKTTLLKLIVGLLRPQRGAISVIGRDVSLLAVEEIAAFVGYVPQDPRALLFHDTLREELAFTLDHQLATNGRGRLSPAFDAHAPSARDDGRIASALDRFGISHLANTYPRDLSGGEAQRAALAAIFVGEPQVLLLDEPTRGLDYHAKAVLGQILRRLAAEGRAIVMATHDVELVAAYADRVALLGDGELIVEGPAREIMSDSLIFSPQVAKLFPHTGWLTVEDALERLKPNSIDRL